MKDFLTGDKLRLELPDNDYDIAFVQFFTLTDTVEMQIGRRKLLRLSAKIDNYSHIAIVWNPKARCIGCYDEEHRKYVDLCTFGELLVQPEVYLTRMLEGGL
ncbi:hypothetical protein [Paenibacillus sp. SAFN-117]|uniref:hypothetical protein n=1 Tax=Paenibacillus sp. SAFN-117 TaxID=3436860 RepID=UPI003F7D1524